MIYDNLQNIKTSRLFFFFKSKRILIWTVHSPQFLREIVDVDRWGRLAAILVSSKTGESIKCPWVVRSLYSPKFRSHHETKMAGRRPRRSTSTISRTNRGTVNSLDNTMSEWSDLCVCFLALSSHASEIFVHTFLYLHSSVVIFYSVLLTKSVVSEVVRLEHFPLCSTSGWVHWKAIHTTSFTFCDPARKKEYEPYKYILQNESLL